VHLASIHRYPVKSCAGISERELRLTATGLPYDRFLMVVTPDGAAVTQREVPALATVTTQLHGSVLTISSPSGDEAALDLADTGEGMPELVVSVWEHRGPALDAGDALADLISAHVGHSYRVVRIGRDHQRGAEPHRSGGGEPLSFADGFPLLLATLASLDDFNSRSPESVSMNRFRPNLVISGAEPFAEDQWRTIRVGDVEIDVVKPCTRCTVTTVNQETGSRAGAEPLRTLGTYRRGRKGVVFGQNGVHRSLGTLRVGDPVEVLR
jgi:uncharacterized protein